MFSSIFVTNERSMVHRKYNYLGVVQTLGIKIYGQFHIRIEGSLILVPAVRLVIIHCTCLNLWGFCMEVVLTEKDKRERIHILQSVP